MTLNDLEPSQKGFLVNFSQYLDAAHISIRNCDEMAGVRPRQPEYEIFSIKRRFQQSKSRSPRFMEPGTGGRRRRLPLPPLKVVILPQLSNVAWKPLQIGRDMLFIINFCDLLQRSVLGPILFLLYTAELFNVIAECGFSRARTIRWRYLNISPADPCCHGNEFWDKIPTTRPPWKIIAPCLHLPLIRSC